MKIEAVVHNMAMKRLQDGQFDRCDMTLRELSTIRREPVQNRLRPSITAGYHLQNRRMRLWTGPAPEEPCCRMFGPDEYELTIDRLPT